MPDSNVRLALNESATITIMGGQYNGLMIGCLVPNGDYWDAWVRKSIKRLGGPMEVVATALDQDAAMKAVLTAWSNWKRENPLDDKNQIG